MNVSVTIYKEKKEKDFRMVILPSGENKIVIKILKRKFLKNGIE